MKKSAILMLNGTSGVGKTTAASELSNAGGISWIHPDGLWDPNSDQRETVFNAVGLAVAKHQDSHIVVIDMQLKHQFMLDAYKEFGVTQGNQILLYCKSSDIEKRLRERGCTNEIIERMISWAQWLHLDSEKAGNEQINTSRSNKAEVVSHILGVITSWGWQYGF